MSEKALPRKVIDGVNHISRSPAGKILIGASVIGAGIAMARFIRDGLPAEEDRPNLEKVFEEIKTIGDREKIRFASDCLFALRFIKDEEGLGVLRVVSYEKANAFVDRTWTVLEPDIVEMAKKAGDPDEQLSQDGRLAQGLIYERYFEDIEKFIGYKLQDPTYKEPRDLAAEVFAKVFKNIIKKEEKINILPYLLISAKHAVTNEQRKLKELTILDDPISQDEPDGGVMVDAIVKSMSIEDAFLKKEHNQRIKDAFLRLTSDQQGCLYLAAVEGMSYKEVADVVDKTEGAVKSLINRARQQLKKAIKNYNILL